MGSTVLDGNRNLDTNAMHQETARFFNETGVPHPDGAVWTGTYVKTWAGQQKLAFHHAGDNVIQLIDFSLHGAKRLSHKSCFAPKTTSFPVIFRENPGLWDSL